MSKIPPTNPAKMDDVYSELNELIIPGIPQMQSPKHHALMPVGASYASLLGSMLCDGLGCIGLTWNECPASTELEMVVMNWMAKLIDLPLDFQFFGKQNTDPGSGGGGMIQASTTESLFTVTVAAKRIMLDHLMGPDVSEGVVTERLVAYCSAQAHPGMERVAEVCGIKLKRLWTDSKGIMHANAIKTIIEGDKQKGFFPFLVVVTMGTIGTVSIDQIDKIVPFCKSLTPQMWVHVESGYVGSAFICREYQPLLLGIDHVDSFSLSAHKWLPVHMDCACLWVKKVNHLTFTFGCEDPNGPLTIPPIPRNDMADYRQWSLPITRRFRAMKLWMVFKLYGSRGLQQKIRTDVRRAKELELLIAEDHRFETMGDTLFGIVPFRCKRPNFNTINKEILQEINKDGTIIMTGVQVGVKFWLRFVITGRQTSTEDVKYSWEIIKTVTSNAIERHHRLRESEGRYGVPNYTHVNKIGKNERLDMETESDGMSGQYTYTTSVGGN